MRNILIEHNIEVAFDKIQEQNVKEIILISDFK